MKLIFIGPPGVGKGSYAKALAKKYNLFHISSGDLLREEIKNKTELGKKVESIMEAGQLVPDDIIVEMIIKKIDKVDNYILDGFPRNIHQAILLDKKINIDAVVEFYAGDELIIKRISGRRVCEKCGAIYHILFKPPKKEGICDFCGGRLIQRKDDTPEVIKERLKVYEETARPLLEHYRDKLIRIDGSASIPEVVEVLEARLKEKGFQLQQ